MRGFSWTVIPITWRNRRHGEAKLKIKGMGNRYLFICLYVWLEKNFSRDAYKKTMTGNEPDELSGIYRQRLEWRCSVLCAGEFPARVSAPRQRRTRRT